MNILIAVDGSHHSAAATRAFNRRTWPPGTRVKLLSVANHGLTAAAKADIVACFEETASILLSGPNQFVLESEIVQGSIRDCILDAAAVMPADLIVVGSRGHSLLDNLLLGSVSQSLLDAAERPVMVAREVQPIAVGHILVPIDDSDCSASAVEWLSKQPWADGQIISLLSVVHNPEPALGGRSITRAGEILMEWETERGLLYVALEYWAALLRVQLPNAEIHYGVIDGDARQLIVKAAENWPADCVVMGSHGRQGLKKLVLGSVSQNVATLAPCSVEIVRGVPSEHFERVQQLIDERRSASPLLNEPSHQEQTSHEVSSPIMFSW